jgi:hypothetical protein
MEAMNSSRPFGIQEICLDDSGRATQTQFHQNVAKRKHIGTDLGNFCTHPSITFCQLHIKAMTGGNIAPLQMQVAVEDKSGAVSERTPRSIQSLEMI